MQGNRYNILYLSYSSTWLLGTLRSGNVTATRTTKTNRFSRQNNSFASISHFFVYKFSAFLHDRECEVMPNFTFYGECRQAQQNFISLSELGYFP